MGTHGVCGVVVRHLWGIGRHGLRVGRTGRYRGNPDALPEGAPPMGSKRVRFAQRRKAAGLSQEKLAERLMVERSTVVRWESGATEPQPWIRPALAAALNVTADELQTLLDETVVAAVPAVSRDGGAALLTSPAATVDGQDAEMAAIELARRIEASDVSDSTLGRLEQVADQMAMAYARTPPKELLPQVRRHLAYVSALVDARMTLTHRRQLLVTGGWLALLAATLHIDLRQGDAARAWLRTAEQMAGQAGHAEIAAWCLETRAWELLTAGGYREALELSQRAQAVAPVGSSALIQATAQEGRAWARMGAASETRSSLARVDRLVSNLPTPDNPEHHYRYDPAKAVSYTATTLSWVGDSAAEGFARIAIRELESEPGGVSRPRRVASARLDLGLALLAAGRPDEASSEALAAVTSGRIVPSNWWRAVEVFQGVTQAGIPEATDLRDAFEAHRPKRSKDSVA
ncbi:helix-turn-helix domain-containing protein [Polymorphospora rubra]|uniref:HTH cro/C1-type domain-containing protein n=2 Tax=Polymorphospora rubra TaxID=338584 RepID=A0A810MSC3_9ACTN|nr:hypothetical protein Prubr_11280 [Polymorphospora rubra]